MKNEAHNEHEGDKEGFLWIGGHTAVDFANTWIIAGTMPADLLADEDAALRWVRAAGFLHGDLASGDTAGFLPELRLLRDAVREALESLAAENTISASSQSTINCYMAAQVGHFVLETATPRLTFQTADEPNRAEQVLARMAHHAAEFLATLDASRLRKCESLTCILLFYDTSKNGTRRWCRMSACGNRAKAAAHYVKKREPKGHS